jgi:hypothetical protein
LPGIGLTVVLKSRTPTNLPFITGAFALTGTLAGLGASAGCVVLVRIAPQREM